jgi:hypothetical protein
MITEKKRVYDVVNLAVLRGIALYCLVSLPALCVGVVPPEEFPFKL